LRSGGATTSTFILEGARAVNSFVIRSPIPANTVVPSEGTLLIYRFILISTSHIMMLWEVVSWMPLAPFQRRGDWKNTSGHLTRSEPTVMMLLSGNSYAFALSGLSDDTFTSVSKSRAKQQSYPFEFALDLVGTRPGIMYEVLWELLLKIITQQASWLYVQTHVPRREHLGICQTWHEASLHLPLGSATGSAGKRTLDLRSTSSAPGPVSCTMSSGN
jgi:hypothetical protein